MLCCVPTFDCLPFHDISVFLLVHQHRTLTHPNSFPLRILSRLLTTVSASLINAQCTVIIYILRRLSRIIIRSLKGMSGLLLVHSIATFHTRHTKKDDRCFKLRPHHLTHYHSLLPCTLFSSNQSQKKF